MYWILDHCSPLHVCVIEDESDFSDLCQEETEKNPPEKIQIPVGSSGA